MKIKEVKISMVRTIGIIKNQPACEIRIEHDDKYAVTVYVTKQIIKDKHVCIRWVGKNYRKISKFQKQIPDKNLCKILHKILD